MVDGTSLERSVADYKAYIEEHRENVARAFDELAPRISSLPGVPGASALELAAAVGEAGRLVPFHDLSKYSDEEFDAYRKRFFPVPGDEVDPDGFARAFAHHVRANPHHPQHWDGRDMPLAYVVEMLCDWEAMSVKFGGSTRGFWESSGKERECMSPATAGLVDALVTALF